MPPLRSPRGLRPKCTVIDDEGRLSIGKFPSVADERPVTKGEGLAMLARRAGLDVADARLVESDGTPIALVRRFDRPAGGGRLMYVSAATMIGAEPGDAGEHAYAEPVDACAGMARARRPMWSKCGDGSPSPS